MQIQRLTVFPIFFARQVQYLVRAQRLKLGPAGGLDNPTRAVGTLVFRTDDKIAVNPIGDDGAPPQGLCAALFGGDAIAVEVRKASYSADTESA